MPSYLATQIIEKRLGYREVADKFPQFKEEMDKLIIARGHGHLIEE